ncbi:hypothetical protein NUSPORA_00278 [Nucleospora cyclopteri]
MSFQNLKEGIKELIDAWDVDCIKNRINEIENTIKTEKSAHSDTSSGLKNEIQTIYKDKERLEAELEMIKGRIVKKMHYTNNTKTQSFNIGKKLLICEQEIENLEAILNEKLYRKKELEIEVNALCSPSIESLNYEFMKGTGLDFIQKEEKIFARIKNQEKNDVFMVNLNGINQEETREAIWSFL